MTTPTLFTFSLPGTPPIWNNSIVRARNGRSFLSAKAKAWKRSIVVRAIVARPKDWPMHERYEVDMLFVFRNPRSDRDGPCKLVQDALEGVAYVNDNQVIGGRTEKMVDAVAPRTTIRVRLV